MTESADVAVFFALTERLRLLGLSPDIPISFPNVTFTPPTNSPWLRGTFLPAPKIATGIDDGSCNEIIGIFQVDVFMPPGSGEPPVARFAQTVMNWFARGTVLTKDGQQVRIWKTPFRSRLLSDNSWVFISVSIPYLAFTINPA